MQTRAKLKALLWKTGHSVRVEWCEPGNKICVVHVGWRIGPVYAMSAFRQNAAPGRSGSPGRAVSLLIAERARQAVLVLPASGYRATITSAVSCMGTLLPARPCIAQSRGYHRIGSFNAAGDRTRYFRAT